MKRPAHRAGAVCWISSSNSGTKARIAVLLFLGVVHVLFTAFYVVPGHMIIDEVIYHWSVRDFAATGQLAVWNGYEEFPSPELVHPFLSPHSGKLYTQYPAMLAAVAFPFYKISGYYGLFILNSIAFLIVVVLCFATARLLFGDIDLALNACLFLALATFAWEYSQAAWPHMISACFAMGSFYLFVCSYESTSNKKAIVAAACAGILAGLGPGLRYDSVYVIPALILPLVFSRKPRIAELTAFVAGTAPGLTLCAYANFLKFGAFSPLADGLGSQLPSYILAFPFVAILLAWLLNRWRIRDFALFHKRQFVAGTVAVLLIALLIPQIRLAAKDLFHYAYVNTVDITAFDEEIIRPSMSRSERGGVVYMGAQKKALLQSMPFLALLVVPLVNLFRKERDSAKLFLLLLLPSIYVAGYSYTFVRMGTFEGGLCLNMRYFVPVLPLLVILCAYAIRNLQEEAGVSFSFPVMMTSALAASGLYFLLVERSKSHVNDLIFPLLALPLLVASFLFCSASIRVSKAGRIFPVDKALAALVAVAFAWSGLVAFAYDYPVARRQRANNYYVSKAALKIVPPDSLFFTAPYVGSFAGLIEQPHVRMAFPGYDRFRDFSRLLQFHLMSGRRCFGAFPEGIWKELRAGPLANLEVRPVMTWPGFFLGETPVLKELRGPLSPR